MRFRNASYRALVLCALAVIAFAPALGRAAADTSPPQVIIEAPKSNELVAPTPDVGPAGIYTMVEIKGSATDDVAVAGAQVRIYDVKANGLPRPVGDGARSYDATCTGCDTPAATWSLKVSLLPGPYTAEIVVADTSGNVPRIAPRVAFFVA